MKSWKQWPYWLKGGLVGGGIATLFALLFDLCTSGVMGDIGYGCVYFLAFQFFPLTWFSNFMGSLWNLYYPSLWEGIVVWFIIGSLIGLLVDILKKRKKDSLI